MSQTYLLLLLSTASSLAPAQLEGLTSELSCPKYACAVTPLSSGICISFANNTHSLAPCSDPLKPYCNTTLSGSISICQAAPTLLPTKAYVGQFCNTTVPCVYGTCSNSVCVGKTQGKSCGSHNECDVGLRCTETRCYPLLRVGDVGCKKDEECELKAGCNLLMGSQKGLCNPYYSVEEGGIATDCTNERSKLCKSGVCITIGGKASKQSYCIAAPALNGTFPLTCTEQSNCTGISRPWNYPGVCSCGYNPTGTAYCSLFPGDQPYQLALSSLAALIAKHTFLACNTARRFQPDCLKTVDPTLYETYRVQSVYAEFYPQLQGNDNCVKRIYTNYYWTMSGWKLAVAFHLLWL